MPRKWTNSSGGSGGALNHKFVPATPVLTLNGEGLPVDLREVDHILARNAKIAGRDKDQFRAGRR